MTAAPEVRVRFKETRTRYPVFDWDSCIIKDGLALECPRTKRRCRHCNRLFVRGEFPSGVKGDEDVKFGFDVCIECGELHEKKQVSEKWG